MSKLLHPPYQLRPAINGQDRRRLQDFIQSAYRRAFDARIPHFLPVLVGLYRADGELVAACGLQLAGTAPLYLEQYLDQPIERLLGKHHPQPVHRAGLVEIGNLATSAPGNGRLMFAAVCRQLYRQGQQWVVFTATQTLLNSFHRLHLSPLELAPADPARVGEDAEHWGRYYQHQPRVMAGELAEGHRILAGNSLLLSLLDPGPAMFSPAREARL
ncbi:thermostable hemolysin [Oceanimonas sp. GK1]|uniref:thermostable hemolysin n=1 Tax=Oceanimonas sp. (strain GK1 / IBRC-M 10197) TaxID=511062 RepID=UPI0002494B46|nr:thermostable hemolysin [Oceanimonas sp. GK1]AEY00331.1 thermostable hemolysin [Oceanimonas sp. GK1]